MKWIVAMLLVAGLAGCTEDEDPPRMEVMTQGFDSQASMPPPGLVISTADSLEDFWNEHRPNSTVPEVDWSEHFLVLLTLGPQAKGGGVIGATSLQWDGANQTYVLGYKVLVPGPDCPDSPPDNPFQLLRIDRVGIGQPEVLLNLVNSGVVKCEAQ